MSKLKDLKLESVLIVIEAYDENVFLAARNLHQVEVLDVDALDPVSLIRYENVLMTVGALKMVEEKLG